MATTSWEEADATEGVSMVVQVTEGGRVVMRFPNSPPFDEKVAEQVAREQAQQAKDPEWKQENTGRWVKETRYYHTQTREEREEPPPKRMRKDTQSDTQEERREESVDEEESEESERSDTTSVSEQSIFPLDVEVKEEGEEESQYEEVLADTPESPTLARDRGSPRE